MCACLAYVNNNYPFLGEISMAPCRLFPQEK